MAAFKNFLLIGGIADGQRKSVEVDDEGTPVLSSLYAVARPGILTPVLPSPWPAERPTEERYRRVALRSTRGWYHVYVADEFADLVLERLLERYRP